MGSFDQPLPQPGKTQVTQAVIQDLLGREQRGIETYGRTLETFNGRSALLDAYHECLDLAQYLKQRLMEEHSRPLVVCLCGSGRFMGAFREAELQLAAAGQIVLSIEHFDAQRTVPELKPALDELHLRKIDLADEVLVLNVGSYIGESTSREIEYATKAGKLIRYLEEKEQELG